MATSGGYARYCTIAGRRFSHIIDPRSLWPVDDLTSATVAAGDCLTANALSTAACVLGGARGSSLAQSFADGHLIAAANGQFWSGGSLSGASTASSLASGRTQLSASSQPAAWPAAYQVTLNLALKAPTGGRGIKRPYVAMWVEDSTGKPVRTLSVWGNQPKYVRELSAWWRASNANQGNVRSVTRATRGAGKYSVVWDGLDDNGKALPTGGYKVLIEINREHGGHVSGSAVIACGGQEKRSATIRATSESDETTIEYAARSR